MRQAASISNRLGRMVAVIAMVAVEIIGCNLPGAAQSADPKKFKSAAEMYATAPVKPMDAVAEALLKKADTAIRGNAKIEDDLVWEAVVALNPYRQDGKVQTNVATWAGRYAKNLGKVEPQGINAPLFTTANQAYKNGKFDEASKNYRKMLAEDPGHFDARNNLALAQMRLGNDLIAQLELLILWQMREEYIPGAVNLTVICERLGQRGKAQALAEKILEKHKDVLAVVHNAAWYKDVAGKHEEALKILEILTDDESKAALKPFRELVEIEAGIVPPYQIGLAGLAGAYESRGRLAAAIVLFIIATLIFIGIAKSASKGKPGCGSIILFSILYLLCWGLPVGYWWIMMVAYVFISLGITAAKA